ncbi:MAG: putative tellurite resistance protein B-like protein [Cocleimonas sp.]
MTIKLKAWFDELGHLEHLDRNDKVLQRAFAVVIYHVIKGDNIETSKEKEKFVSFFKNDFDLDEAHINQLHDEASKFNGEFETYLAVLKEKISVYPEVEVKLMQTLNSILTSQKFNVDEYGAFEDVKKSLFG